MSTLIPTHHLNGPSKLSRSIQPFGRKLWIWKKSTFKLGSLLKVRKIGALAVVASI